MEYGPQNPLFLGIDVGSTTVKTVLRDGDQILFEKYARHFSQVREKTAEMLGELAPVAGERPVAAAISGSAGLGLAEAIGAPFVQEVFATGEVVHRLEPDAACVIELGGEDAKIIFFDGAGVDERMNGSCAGGTGAFIDQMATLLNVTPDELDALSLHCERIYPIASRCGVFAKSDIQPLLNQGARKENVAASIYQAVVNQTIAGLAQGRQISGKVLFLGGPLYYCQGLRRRFSETLKLDAQHAIFPEYGRFAVALGASMMAEKQPQWASAAEWREKITRAVGIADVRSRLQPLFANEEELAQFRARHAKATVPQASLDDYRGKAWLGIDCGSTTTKLALISEKDELLWSFYASNQGNPVEIVRAQLSQLYARCGDRVQIAGSAVTGYGEELVQRAFGVDYGVVETIAHYTAARHFQPNVDFILDIGGQDIKCFKIRNGAIESIMLNEACSSGCGSFLETFARALGEPIAEFAQRGLAARAPVNLGSRCTVFMNSSVKQSQKDGASVEDISAGLSISVVKNAIYKVIRASRPEELGEHIVVQGGTFCNDAVLRAFERELGHDVIRPAIAGLMGAFGAALYSKKCKNSTLISADALAHFVHTSKPAVCHGCANHCRLTVNSFGDGKKPLISGNQCDRGAGASKALAADVPDLYEEKRAWVASLKPTIGAPRGRLGLPLALGTFELLPLWHRLFTELGYEVVVSPMSTRSTYVHGQFTIPSDTACYPAKLMHGHIAALLDAPEPIPHIFYPCLTYNVDEHAGDNHYNCPVVAYYSELLHGNIPELTSDRFWYPYLNINSPRQLTRELTSFLQEKGQNVTQHEVRRAVQAGMQAYEEHMARVRARGEAALAWAKAHGKRVMILAGRPYHIDSEICHGIDRLAASLGFVVVSEDSVCHLVQPEPVHVLNQWTYHARLYRAARFAAMHPGVELVQLVSFGCGVDAITTDEVRRILEGANKFYTQIKIDEITNLGAVKIRLRSLLGALEEREEGGAGR